MESCTALHISVRAVSMTNIESEEILVYDTLCQRLKMSLISVWHYATSPNVCLNFANARPLSKFLLWFQMAPKKKPKFEYSHEQLEQALEAYRKGKNAFSVSKRFGVPRSTLIYKALGKTPINKKEDWDQHLVLDSTQKVCWKIGSWLWLLEVSHKKNWFAYLSSSNIERHEVRISFSWRQTWTYMVGLVLEKKSRN